LGLLLKKGGNRKVDEKKTGADVTGDSLLRSEMDADKKGGRGSHLGRARNTGFEQVKG